MAITAGREQTLLAMLLLHANQPVSTDLLIDAIWHTETPHNARNQLQTCVYRLRKWLSEAGAGEKLIANEPGGYRITVTPNDLDLYEFRRLVQEARTATTAGNHHDAKVTYRAALDLWRGPALAGIDSHPVRGAAANLDEERVQALEECLDTELAAGGAGELVAELTELATRHPHREGLHRALMLALYRTGRQADALAAYRHARQLLHDDLGAEPSAELQQLHHAILNRDPDLDAVQPSGPPAAPAPLRPRELPPDVAGFTGRLEALKALDELQSSGDDLTGPVVISAIAGTAGVGKTALAVHWAHRAAERFPDGQLYLNLRGYATGTPVRPIEALSMMLRSLGMASEQIPVGEAEASARYRSLLADRRVLVVLDNARSVDQVRPLLPGSPGCLALVTSRDRLAGLVARDGAHRISLDVLPADEAHTLLTRLLGDERGAAEPEATAQLASACAYLPLALRIAAASLADRPDRRIEDLVSDLSSGQRLAALVVEGDQDTAVRATLDFSYHTIPEAAQRVFRLLGLIPGPDFTPDAAAALADLTSDEARRILDRLTNAHLVEEHTPGRYTFHDLLREYARDRAGRDDSDNDRNAAWLRVTSWYLHSTDAASGALRPRGTALSLPPALPRQTLVPPADRREALATIDSERTNLVAAVLRAAQGGPRTIAWLLADRLRPYFRLRPGEDALAVGQAALAASNAEGTQRDQAAAQFVLAEHHARSRENRRALRHYELALALSRQAGWTRSECAAHAGLAFLTIDLGRLDDAASHVNRMLALSQQNGWIGPRTSSLSMLAYLHRTRGDLREAVGRTQDALASSREMADPLGDAIEQVNLGHGYMLLGHLSEAMDWATTALAAFREHGHRAGEAEAQLISAAVHNAAGRHDEALLEANEALALTHGTGDRHALASVMNTLGAIHHDVDNQQLALAHWERAVELAEPDGTYPKIDALIGLAATQNALEQRESATEHAFHALELARGIGYRVLEGRALSVLTDIHLNQGKLDEAHTRGELALRNHRHTGHRLGEAQALIVLGRVQCLVGDSQAGQQYWLAAREVLEDIGAPVPADVIEGLRRA